MEFVKNNLYITTGSWRCRIRIFVLNERASDIVWVTMGPPILIVFGIKKIFILLFLYTVEVSYRDVGQLKSRI